MSGHENGAAAANGDAPELTLYTNHICPYAHRAHIVLKELGLAHEEVFIDLTKPREPWYLDVNPRKRGLVPSITIASPDFTPPQTLTESAIVSQFLADLHPSHLSPAPTSPNGALKRARIAFFTDTWDTKVSSFMWKALLAPSEAETESTCSAWVAAMGKEIEPLLKDAKPFFGGSDKITLAEVHTAPFILRIYALAKHGLLPASVAEQLDSLPNFSRWAHAVMQNESVLGIWDEEFTMGYSKKMIAKRKEAAKAAAN